MSHKVDASTRYRPVIHAVYRIALENANKEVRDRPSNGDATKNHAYDAEVLHREDSIEKGQEGHFVEAIRESVERQRQPEILQQAISELI